MMAAAEPPEGPPEVYGAAPERTALAWQRTGLGVIVGSFLVFRISVQLGVLPIGVAAVGLGLLIAALSVFVFPIGRYQRGDPADSWTLLIVIGVAVALLGALGAVAATLLLVG